MCIIDRYSEDSIISESLIKVVNTCCGLNLNRAFVVKQSEDFFFEPGGIFGKYLLLPNNREVRFVVARRKTQGTFIDAFISEYQVTKTVLVPSVTGFTSCGDSFPT